MVGAAFTNVPGESVSVDGIPGATERLPLYEDSFSYSPGFYVHGAKFTDPAPGAVWEKNYDFYVNGVYGATVTIPSGTIKQLSCVGNPEVSEGIHPTVTWDAVLMNPDGGYDVRIYEVTDNDTNFRILYRSPYIPADGSSNYSFTYQGDLFNQYDTLAIDIVAGELVTGFEGGLRNRSQYFIKHSAVAPPNQPPEIVYFVVDYDCNPDPLTVCFTCYANDANDDISQYIFDFGDGYPQYSEDATITHAYSQGRSYKATCTVVDQAGNQTPPEDLYFTLNREAKLYGLFVGGRAWREDIYEGPELRGDLIAIELAQKFSNLGNVAYTQVLYSSDWRVPIAESQVIKAIDDLGLLPIEWVKLVIE
jgi:PKD repeat protein